MAVHPRTTSLAYMQAQCANMLGTIQISIARPATGRCECLFHARKYISSGCHRWHSCAAATVMPALGSPFPPTIDRFAGRWLITIAYSGCHTTWLPL
jgi:hypothetical protein